MTKMLTSLRSLAFTRDTAIGLIVTGAVLVFALLLPPAGKPSIPSWALAMHVTTTMLALPLGAWVLYRPKGTAPHKRAGRIWVVLMLLASFSSFFIQSWGRFSPIHIFSVWTPISLTMGILAAQRGNTKAHVHCMRGAYVGLIVAGILAVALPGRFLWRAVFG